MGKETFCVLVTDDEEFIREVLEEGLQEEMDLEIEVAENGTEALDLTEKIKYDLIVTDFRMPELNGGELVHSIRERKGPNRDVPVLFISAFLEEAKESSKGLNNIFYMEKPLIFSKLKNKILGILETIP